MIRLTIRIPDELHEKLRWLCFKERRSQQIVLVEILEKALADVQPPKEGHE
jgi:predicted DNA-binding protein